MKRDPKSRQAAERVVIRANKLVFAIGIEAASGGIDNTVAIVFAVALVVGLSCIAAGYAVGRVGSAALGAASERPELLGRSLILVGLAEGIAIYGLIIGIMLMQRMPK